MKLGDFTMKILVGTKNERKIQAVQVVLDKIGLGDEYSVGGCDVSSGVSGTPFDQETKQGAVNRAQNAQASDAVYDMYIGIESGLVVRYGDMFEEVWVAVIVGGRQYVAYSSGIYLPKCVVAGLNESDISNHPKVMNNLRNLHKIDKCAILGTDTWGDYTGGEIAREVGLEEALRNAFVQVFHKEKSLYGVDE